MLLKLGQQIRQVYDRAEGCMRRGRRLPPISRLMQRRVILNAMVDLSR
jgi:hypothetical protein